MNCGSRIGLNLTRRDRSTPVADICWEASRPVDNSKDDDLVVPDAIDQPIAVDDAFAHRWIIPARNPTPHLRESNEILGRIKECANDDTAISLGIARYVRGYGLNVV